jgi:predicted metalloprotease with PDZ domain
VQSVASASFDAWIKLYRPDENSPNVSISYYVKGAVVAFLLDLEIRRLTGNRRSLDDVMRAAFKRYAGARGFTDEEFRALAGEVAGASLAAFFPSALDGTGELDYTSAFESLGLRFKTAESAPGKKPGRATLGVVTKMDGNRLVVAQVRRGTVAHEAGVNVDDEIIAIDDFRVRPDQLDGRMDQYIPGERVSLLVARRDRLLRLDLTLGLEPLKVWQLEMDPAGTPAQRALLDSWLSPTGSTM